MNEDTLLYMNDWELRGRGADNQMTRYEAKISHSFHQRMIEAFTAYNDAKPKDRWACKREVEIILKALTRLDTKYTLFYDYEEGMKMIRFVIIEGAMIWIKAFPKPIDFSKQTGSEVI